MNKIATSTLKAFPKVANQLPTGWTRVRLDDIATRRSGHTPNQKKSEYWNGGVKWVSLADSGILDNGYISSTDKEISHLGVRHSSAVLLPAETVILSRDAGIGKSAILQSEMAVSQHFIAWTCQPGGQIDPWFLYFWMQTQKPFFERMAVGSTIKTIGLALFKKLTIDLPPLPEQRKIAEILRTWDEALAALTALRNAKADALTALLQNLIGINSGADRNWEMKPLHELATRVRRKNDGGDHPVMTISAKSGFLLQSDRYSRNMAGRSVENYTIIHEGDFAYNKGNSKTAPQGCIFVLDRPTALVPNVYICFALQEGLNREFYGHLFSAGALNHQLSRVINSGVRNDGLLNLNASDFFDCKLPLPPIEEQQAIAAALTTAKQELTLIDRQIDALSRQKRGLMQKLLTGEWRVKGEAE